MNLEMSNNMPEEFQDKEDLQMFGVDIAGVEVVPVEWSRHPCRLISRGAGTSCNKNDNSFNRVARCFKAGHMSVFEHASITFDVLCSRSCSHQLVRHRFISPTQLSQRYVKNQDTFIIPPTVERDVAEKLLKLYIIAMLGYNKLIESGVKSEDARYALPEGTATRLTITMNARELFHFLDVRTDPHAQFEIRFIAWKMVETLQEIPGWKKLVALWLNKEGLKERHAAWLEELLRLDCI